MKAAGKSRPTVPRALKQLDYYLIRHTDRSVELKSFPAEAWEGKLIAGSDECGRRFDLASGQGSLARPSHCSAAPTIIRDGAVSGVIGREALSRGRRSY